jgi:large subunit ribosomal protein L10e
MAIRKASSYSKRIARPFTRKSGQKSKAYVKVVPNIKIGKFKFGNENDSSTGKHPYRVRLINHEKTQVRDVALEACRMYTHKMMEAGAPGQFYLNVKIYPHHMLRENKISSGAAGADRTSTGMTQSFGQVMGRAALVSPNTEIIVISCSNEKAAKVARDALHSVKAKIPGKTSVIFEKVN